MRPRQRLGAEELVAAFAPARPRVPALRPGVHVTWREESALVRRNGDESVVLAAAPVLADLHALLAEGRAYPDVQARSSDPEFLLVLLQQLAFQGYVEETDVPGTDCSGLNVVAHVQDAIAAAAASPSPAGGGAGEVLEEVMRGSASKSTVRAWCEAQAVFTANAAHHMAPAIERGTTAKEREAWHSLCEDEVTHYRIWTRSFADLGTTFENARRNAPGAMQALSDHIHRLACADQYAWAAALLFLEEPCDETPVLDHPVYGALHRHYGLRVESVAPLYWHSRENETKGHRDVMAAALASRARYTAAEVDSLVEAAVRTVILSRAASDLEAA